MSRYRKLLLICITCLLGFSGHSSFGQVTPKKDSAAIYRKIEKYSKKRRFTKFIHGLVFEPLTPKDHREKKKIESIQFKEFQGKAIRKIKITTLDPFGFSAEDSTRFPQKPLSQLGNRLHLKSKELTIWNLILLRRNKPLDSLLVKESERLIRTQRFVRRVLIRPVASPYPDSVDVDIRVLDSWSLILNLAMSSSRANYQLTERNFLGIGHELHQDYKRNMNNGDDAYSARYTIPNVMNTYIRTDLIYNQELDRTYQKSVNVNRPFYSPFARWGAGAYFDTQFRADSLFASDGSRARQSFKSNITDLWAGHSIRMIKGNTENARTTNLITSARYYKVNFTEVPDFAYDTVSFYRTERNYLVGIGIASRQFVQDHYLFNYGIIEDVPIGQTAGIIGGLHFKNGSSQTYLGARYSTGNYYDFGFCGYNVEYGSFFRDGRSVRSAMVFESNYFTPLFESGKWKFRQFLKARAVIGNRRERSWGDSMHLIGEDGIPGFRSNTLYGSKKWTMTSQTQTYAPWNVFGFRFNPFLGVSLGMLGDAEHGFRKSGLYSQVGIGFIITNDYLVFSSFQLSFSYLPNLPDIHGGRFSSNAFSTSDFGLMDFEFSKPQFVDYR